MEGASGEATPPLSQPRAEALLAVLAVSGDLGRTRERLIGLFWPESDSATARHNLRDVLHALRQTLGRAAVQSVGDVLRLDRSVVSSDVQAFASALAAGRLATAVSTYRGPLLDGFYLSGAPEFERWLEDERARLAREFEQAAKRLAKRAEREDRWDAAAGWWARAIESDPYNSRMLVRRMVALARAGDRANAIKEAEAHSGLLQAELGLDPDPALLEELGRIRSGETGPPQFFTPCPPSFRQPPPPDPEPPGS